MTTRKQISIFSDTMNYMMKSQVLPNGSKGVRFALEVAFKFVPRIANIHVKALVITRVKTLVVLPMDIDVDINPINITEGGENNGRHF